MILLVWAGAGVSRGHRFERHEKPNRSKMMLKSVIESYNQRRPA
jgi:hypothetical protein